jgi:hypothetical protein
VYRGLWKSIWMPWLRVGSSVRGGDALQGRQSWCHAHIGKLADRGREHNRKARA